MQCPKCGEQGFDYKKFLLYNQVECKKCRYFIRLSELTEDQIKYINN